MAHYTSITGKLEELHYDVTIFEDEVSLIKESQMLSNGLIYRQVIRKYTAEEQEAGVTPEGVKPIGVIIDTYRYKKEMVS